MDIASSSMTRHLHVTQITGDFHGAQRISAREPVVDARVRRGLHSRRPRRAAGTAATAPTVGQMAPDFTLPGATRYGLLAKPVKLSDFRGQSVVIAFFPKARTKG